MRQHIRNRRLKLKLSQREVGKLAGMTRANYSHVESGRNKNLSIDQMEAIAKALKTRATINFFRDYCDGMEQSSRR